VWVLSIVGQCQLFAQSFDEVIVRPAVGTMGVGGRNGRLGAQRQAELVHQNVRPLGGYTQCMDGERMVIASVDGASIGLISAGSGDPLLLIHGGMGRAERWEPLWGTLCSRFRVTAMDRRGRGTSTDGPSYSAALESADIVAVVHHLAEQSGRGPHVVAHSIGATFSIAAAADNADVRRLVLYEPPGPETVAGGWADRVAELVARGEVGRAAASFLGDIIELSPEEIVRLRGQSGGSDVLAIVAATLPREARALETIAFGCSRRITASVLLLLGSSSPPWARSITRHLESLIPRAKVVELTGQGHEAIDTDPDRVLEEVLGFFDPRTMPV
jgi:pimeloyl-ACP methyl ester carboxylesterase